VIIIQLTRLMLLGLQYTQSPHPVTLRQPTGLK